MDVTVIGLGRERDPAVQRLHSYNTPNVENCRNHHTFRVLSYHNVVAISAPRNEVETCASHISQQDKKSPIVNLQCIFPECLWELNSIVSA